MDSVVYTSNRTELCQENEVRLLIGKHHVFRFDDLMNVVLLVNELHDE